MDLEDNQNISHLDIEGNVIYFSGELNIATTYSLTKMITDFENEQINNKMIKKPYHDELKFVFVNSYGGFTYSGLALYDLIKNLQVKTSAKAYGICASAGTKVFLGCQKRFASKNTSFLIHQLSGVVHGTYEQMSDNLFYSKMLMKQTEQVYLDNLNISKKKIKEILKKDWFVDSKGALELGLIQGYC